MKEQSAVMVERPIAPGPISKVVGLYQTFLRRSLEHFFPDATLDGGRGSEPASTGTGRRDRTTTG